MGTSTAGKKCPICGEWISTDAPPLRVSERIVCERRSSERVSGPSSDLPSRLFAMEQTIPSSRYRNGHFRNGVRSWSLLLERSPLAVSDLDAPSPWDSSTHNLSQKALRFQDPVGRGASSRPYLLT